MLETAPNFISMPAVTLKEVLQPEIVEKYHDNNDPMAVRISHNLFIDAQFSAKKLHKI